MANRKITKDVSDYVIAGAVLGNFYLNKLDRILEWGSKTTVIVRGSNNISINIGDNWYFLDTDIVSTIATDLDTGVIQAGKDYNTYLCENAGSIIVKHSLNTTYPSGFTAATSRKIGGFHTLCVAAGDIAGGYRARANSTAYNVGDKRRPAVANSRYYVCVTSGTSGVSEPAAFSSDSTKVGQRITDGTVVWRCIGHDLNNYIAGDILPLSVWDLKFRCNNGINVGMVWSPQRRKWVQIYLPSDNGSGGIQSVYNATILDTVDWNDIADYAALDGYDLIDDLQFQAIAEGSNEETNVSGSADPVTTGGHSDGSANWVATTAYTLNTQVVPVGGNGYIYRCTTAGTSGASAPVFPTVLGNTVTDGTVVWTCQFAVRRIISNIGIEDGVGVVWQWTKTPSVRLDDGTAAGWFALPGGKGQFYTYGTNKYGNTQLLAGGAWGGGADCGSRSRDAGSYRWVVSAPIGGRFLAEPL